MLSAGIRVAAQKAEKAHKLLIEMHFFDKSKKAVREKNSVIFPVLAEVKKAPALVKKIDSSASLVKKKFPSREDKPANLKDALAGKLSAKEFGLLQSSHDSLGDVAIIEVAKGLEKKAGVIGKALLESKPSLKSVFMKAGAHQGVFREEPVKLIAGKKTEFALYKEHGCTFRISLGKVFFSPRLGTERLRIAGQIKKGEKIACLFAGVGPFPIVFAKNSGVDWAIAVELNPVAVQDMVHNISLNKVSSKVEPVLGDVKKLSEKYSGQFDRAVMPLPKGGEDFLADAIKYLKPEGGIVHYYQFSPRQNPYEVPLMQVKAACEKLGRKFEVMEKKQVREFSKETIQVVLDIKVWK